MMDTEINGSNFTWVWEVVTMHKTLYAYIAYNCAQVCVGTEKDKICMYTVCWMNSPAYLQVDLLQHIRSHMLITSYYYSFHCIWDFNYLSIQLCWIEIPLSVTSTLPRRWMDIIVMLVEWLLLWGREYMSFWLTPSLHACKTSSGTGVFHASVKDTFAWALVWGRNYTNMDIILCLLYDNNSWI